MVRSLYVFDMPLSLFVCVSLSLSFSVMQLKSRDMKRHFCARARA